MTNNSSLTKPSNRTYAVAEVAQELGITELQVNILATQLGISDAPFSQGQFDAMKLSQSGEVEQSAIAPSVQPEPPTETQPEPRRLLNLDDVTAAIADEAERQLVERLTNDLQSRMPDIQTKVFQNLVVTDINHK